MRDVRRVCGGADGRHGPHLGNAPCSSQDSCTAQGMAYEQLWCDVLLTQVVGGTDEILHVRGEVGTGEITLPWRSSPLSASRPCSSRLPPRRGRNRLTTPATCKRPGPPSRCSVTSRGNVCETVWARSSPIPRCGPRWRGGPGHMGAQMRQSGSWTWSFPPRPTEPNAVTEGGGRRARCAAPCPPRSARHRRQGADSPRGDPLSQVRR